MARPALHALRVEDTGGGISLKRQTQRSFSTYTWSGYNRDEKKANWAE